MTTQLRNTALLLIVSLTFLTSGSNAKAQHSDIEFEYEDNKIVIEFGEEGRVYEGDFAISGPEEQVTAEPGFGSEVAEGAGVNPGDTIDYEILGPLQFHNGTDFATLPAMASITISDKPSGDFMVDGNTSGPVSGPGIIDIADATTGDVHADLTFTLGPSSLDTADYGAYALPMRLITDASGVAPSDKFFIVFNFGLEESVFEGAVGAFAATIPEPTSFLLASMGLLGLSCYRRRFES